MVDGTRRAALAAAAVGVVAFGLVAWTRALESSVRAKLINDVALPLSGMKRKARDARALRRQIARHRRVEPARPSPWLCRRLIVQTKIIDGVEVFTIRPRGPSSGTTILYIHGGAWVFDVLAPHWWIVEALVVRTGARVILPRYPLAPECTWRETYSFLDRLLGSELAADRERLIVAGDSAGGCLSVGLSQRLLARGEKCPAGLLLFSPALDLTFADPMVRALEPRDPMLAIAGCQAAARLWAAGTPLTDARISPLFGRLDGLPPVAIFTGTRDLLHPDALRLHRGLTRARQATELYCYRGLCHVFVGAPIPEADQALDEAGVFVRNCLGAASTRA